MEKHRKRYHDNNQKSSNNSATMAKDTSGKPRKHRKRKAHEEKNSRAHAPDHIASSSCVNNKANSHYISEEKPKRKGREMENGHNNNDEVVNALMKQVVGMEFVNAKRVLRTRLRRKREVPQDGLTLAERILLSRKRKEGEEATLAENVSTRQRLDSVSVSVDISEYLNVDETKRTPTPEPTFINYRENSAENRVTAKTENGHQRTSSDVTEVREYSEKDLKRRHSNRDLLREVETKKVQLQSKSSTPPLPPIIDATSQDERDAQTTASRRSMSRVQSTSSLPRIGSGSLVGNSNVMQKTNTTEEHRDQHTTSRCTSSSKSFVHEKNTLIEKKDESTTKSEKIIEKDTVRMSESRKSDRSEYRKKSHSPNNQNEETKYNEYRKDTEVEVHSSNEHVNKEIQKSEKSVVENSNMVVVDSHNIESRHSDTNMRNETPISIKSPTPPPNTDQLTDRKSRLSMSRNSIQTEINKDEVQRKLFTPSKPPKQTPQPDGKKQQAPQIVKENSVSASVKPDTPKPKPIKSPDIEKEAQNSPAGENMSPDKTPDSKSDEDTKHDSPVVLEAGEGSPVLIDEPTNQPTSKPEPETQPDVEKEPDEPSTSGEPDEQEAEKEPIVEENDETNDESPESEPDNSIDLSTTELNNAVKQLDKLADHNLNLLMGRDNGEPEPKVDKSIMDKVFSEEFQKNMDNFLNST